MKVLWFSNIILPQVAKEFNSEKVHGGGWMTSLAELIENDDRIQLFVAAPGTSDNIKTIEKKGVKYLIYPIKNYSVTKAKSEASKDLKKIIEEINPDIIHIFGTEFPYGFEVLKISENIPSVISIQGLVSEISKYYLAGISPLDIIKNITFRDLIKRDTIFQAKKKFSIRGKNEIKTIKLAKNVIGRTEWDYYKTKSINMDINYYHCAETLRQSFKLEGWNIHSCQKRSIFVSQGMYPIKGIHILIKAVERLKYKYPDIKIYVAGANKINLQGFKNQIKRDGYSKYLINLIKKCEVEKNIEFLGVLNEQEMAKNMCKAHVSIIPSAIENSPNSLIEAMSMGVPSIGAYSGGIPNFIKNNETGFLYRFEDYELLSMLIDKIFSDEKLAIKFSENAKNYFNEYYIKNCVLEDTYDIYRQILNKNNN